MIAPLTPLTLGIFLASLVYLLVGWQLLLVKARQSPGGQLRFWGFGLAWMALTGGLAAAGVLNNPTGLPPRIVVILLPMAVAMLWLSFTPRVRDFLRRVPAAWLIGLQSFRVLVEIALHRFAHEGQLPYEMTWEGHNFDVVIGLTALPLALWVHRAKELPRGVVRLWNVLGIGFVTAVAVHGILSAPSPFQVLHFSQDNTIIMTLPGVWLPAVEVLSAYALHILSLRQMRQAQVA